MSTHERQLQLLADALRLPSGAQVVPTLRRRDVLYYGPGGALLFACGADWSDERLVTAAVHLFIHDGVPPPSEARADRDGDTSERMIDTIFT